MWLTSASLLAAVAVNNTARADAGDSQWAELMLAKRAAMQGKASVQQSRWYATAALKATSFAQELFPERGVQLEDGAKKKTWQAKSYPDGKVNYLRAREGNVIYLYRTLVTKAPVAMQLQIGGGEGLALWVNDQRLVNRATASKETETLQVNLRAGRISGLLRRAWAMALSKVQGSAAAPIASIPPLRNKIKYHAFICRQSICSICLSRIKCSCSSISQGDSILHGHKLASTTGG